MYSHDWEVYVPACSSERALELPVAVQPILERLYPEWRTDATPDPYYGAELGQTRKAAQILLAQLKHWPETMALVDSVPRTVESGLHERVWQAARPQWELGHYNDAVLEAAKAVNLMLQQKTGRTDISDKALVTEVFSPDPPKPGRPRMRLDDLPDDQTRTSMNEGVASFARGCVQAIRNPLGHLPADEHPLSQQEAFEQLAALSLLARWIDRARLHTADGEEQRSAASQHTAR